MDAAEKWDRETDQTPEIKEGPITALVLAASRLGAEDTVAQLQGLSHKCLVVIDGMVMIERVIRELQATATVGRIVVSIEEGSILRNVPYLAAELDAGRISTVKSSGNLYSSVVDAVEQINAPYPLMITTADNALHTSEMIDHFGKNVLAGDSDVAVAMTSADVILAKYPEGRRAFHQLKDGGYSSCNLYALKSDKALKSAKIFEGGGQFGKKPSRILKSFGLLFMILYKYKLATLQGLARRLSKRLNLAIEPVLLPFAEGPIDVDNPKDFALTEQILQTRRQEV